MEKRFSYSYFDLLFPYHMYLGKLEKKENENYQFTTLKTFNRRRIYLIWLFNNKYDKILTNEERSTRNEAESIVFKWNVIFKALSVFLLMSLRSRNRSAGRSLLFDFFLVYSGVYSFLLSNVFGVHKAWHLYEPLAKKMIQSKIRVKPDEIMEST